LGAGREPDADVVPDADVGPDADVVPDADVGPGADGFSFCMFASPSLAAFTFAWRSVRRP
jgi:hypothetical protein